MLDRRPQYKKKMAPKMMKTRKWKNNVFHRYYLFISFRTKPTTLYLDFMFVFGFIFYCWVVFLPRTTAKNYIRHLCSQLTRTEATQNQPHGEQSNEDKTHDKVVTHYTRELRNVINKWQICGQNFFILSHRMLDPCVCLCLCSAQWMWMYDCVLVTFTCIGLNFTPVLTLTTHIHIFFS